MVAGPDAPAWAACANLSSMDLGWMRTESEAEAITLFFQSEIARRRTGRAAAGGGKDGRQLPTPSGCSAASSSSGRACSPSGTAIVPTSRSRPCELRKSISAKHGDDLVAALAPAFGWAEP